MKTRESSTGVVRNAAHMLLAVALMTGTVKLRADTFASGLVAGQTWTASASPYVVTGDVSVVGPGLTIQSNVIVKFAGPYEFKVVGPLQVSGISNAPVIFTRQDATNGWRGILFDQADAGSFFSYAIIEGATNSGVRITNTPPAFTNCIVRNNASPGNGGGIMADVAANTLVMYGCLVTNNVAGSNAWGGGVWVGHRS